MIALATCATVPAWEVDDNVFHAALKARGIEARQCVWDDPHVDWARFDLVLIRTTWDYHEKRGAFVSWAQAIPVPLHNPAPIISWNTHKSHLGELEARGVPIIPTEWPSRGTTADVASVCERRGWRRAFLKPCVGATSRETLRFEAGDPGAQRHADRLLVHEDVMLQPYLDRVETDGEVSAIFIDGELTHAVRKIPVSGDYRVQDDFGAKDYAIDFPDRALARRAVDAAGADLLYARADFLLADEGLLPLLPPLAASRRFSRECDCETAIGPARAISGAGVTPSTSSIRSARGDRPTGRSGRHAVSLWSRSSSRR